MGSFTSEFQFPNKEQPLLWNMTELNANVVSGLQINRSGLGSLQNSQLYKQNSELRQLAWLLHITERQVFMQQFSSSKPVMRLSWETERERRDASMI
jgi:hypothetical protein